MSPKDICGLICGSKEYKAPKAAARLFHGKSNGNGYRGALVITGNILFCGESVLLDRISEDTPDCAENSLNRLMFCLVS